MEVIFGTDLIKTPNALPQKKLSLALGFFDGVHLAHCKILDRAVELARKNGIKSAVITFKESPGGYFTPEKKINLQTLSDRISLIAKRGIDAAYVLDFNDFKHLDAESYLKDVLIKYFSPKFIVSGFNHTFGRNKTGNSAFLYQNQTLGYKYIEIEKMRINNTLVSSTNIKRFIQKAYIKEANALLGYEFNVEGRVENGLKLARALGFKTVNLSWKDNIVKPPFGVYYGSVEYGGRELPALINWGIKPTVNKALGKAFENPVLEAHILDFNKEIYGESIRIFFKSPLREEKKFANLDELKQAISNDIAGIRSLSQNHEGQH